MTATPFGWFAAGALTALSCAVSVPAIAARDNTPPALSQARDRGPADPTKVITITVQLNRSNDAVFRNTVDALYDPKSPSFHHWLTDADLRAFAPAPAQVAAVRAALERQGLAIVSTSRNGFSLRARGTIAAVAKAFNTEIHNFERNGQVFRANISNARLSGDAGDYVAAVAGLESHVVHPMLARAHNLRTGQPYAAVKLKDVEAAGGLGAIITDQALSPPQTFNYTTPGAPLPTATYSGIIYDNNPDLFPDFSGKALEKAYRLAPAYKLGLDGTGQTIVLLEGYGYPTAEADANAGFRLNHLPPLTSANFNVVYPEGAPADPNAGILVGWNVEIALDIQSSHAIAPGANILVVATNGQDNEDFQASMQYIVDNNLGSTVSDSWEEDTDLVAGPYEQESYENILIVAAAKGVSFQFSTGDDGDGGLGTPVGAAGVPSVAPHATAVGGTAILNKIGTTKFESTGWGDALALVDDFGPYDPPSSYYIFGGGGGESVFWPKPVWQVALPGTGRQTPDISALADPYTGFALVVTDGTTKELLYGVGGTSLASPIVTAFWALAQQKAGHALGQAAPTIAGLTSGIIDVVPLTSGANVSGSITDSSGTTDYSTLALFAGLIPDNQPFIAALWNQPEYDDAAGFAFALDSSLNVTVGWDNATGYGTPDGLAFIDAAAAYGR
jgi:subtilase family serine protease